MNGSPDEKPYVGYLQGILSTNINAGQGVAGCADAYQNLEWFENGYYDTGADIFGFNGGSLCSKPMATIF